MEKLKLDLTLDEVNLILKALGNLPFSEVYQLVAKINDQANNQLTDQNSNNP